MIKLTKGTFNMFIPVSVNIGGLEINNTDHLGSVSFGTNVKVGRNVSAKKNQGFGQQHADASPRFFTVQMVLDDDKLDSFSQKNNL